MTLSEQAKLTDEEQDNCVPTEAEIEAYLAEPDDAVAASLTPSVKRLVAARVLYGKKCADAAQSKLLSLLSKEGKEIDKEKLAILCADIEGLADASDWDELEDEIKDKCRDDAAEIILFFQPYVTAANARAEKAEAEVKRLKGLMFSESQKDCIVWSDCSTCPQGKRDSSGMVITCDVDHEGIRAKAVEQALASPSNKAKE